MDYASSGTDVEEKWEALAGKGWKFENNVWKRIDIPGISDASIWRLFAYSIQASGQPQYVTMLSNAGGGHAMICYAVSNNGNLLVADPNYHGRDDRKIEYADGKFKPYSSGDSEADIKAGKGKTYEKIVYGGAWTIVPYDKIAQRWTEFKNKTIGNDRFPAYNIYYKDDNDERHLLNDGTVFSNNELRPSYGSNSSAIGCEIYRDGEKLVNLGLMYQVATLKPGNNKLGFAVYNGSGHYIDFQYINVIYNSLAIDPASLDGEPDKQYTFTAKTDSPPNGARYDWYVDGSKSQSDTSTSFTTRFKSEGSHKISVKLVDSAGKEILEAQADVAIRASTTAGLEQLQQMSHFTLNLECDSFLFDMWTQSKDVSPEVLGRTLIIPASGEYGMAITWNGTSFSGKSGTNEEIKGTVSSDGKTLLSVEYNCSLKGRTETVASYKLQNIPINTVIKENPQNYIVKLEYRYASYREGGEKYREETLQSPPIKEYKFLYLHCSFW